ncbi:uncharacterized protein CELE_F31F6.2 [Caenorhabditis elegans]|uniref:Uncharacterized protein n=1 Tax=Caenorhabditis elegans TaxID=6239 RepID=Q19943_CAEEL|nr:Uncharacterized protein CELE_F31F6.2 [Caenorhabditis elegans]CAA93749.1 Uncharacterized protein CELE_F31F6.2 [Caenorhabditis elegans]|eukprot:NP_510469.1 Uncharacterized protein CELE_F31F6.2 [Caenorhabditis elegans]
MVTPIEQSFQHLADEPTSLNLIRFTAEMIEMTTELPFKKMQAGLIKSIAHILHDEKFEKIRGPQAMLKLMMLAYYTTKVGVPEVDNHTYGLDMFNDYKQFFFQWAHGCGKKKAVSEFRTVFHLALSNLYYQMSPTLIVKDFEKIFQQYFGQLPMISGLERKALDKLFGRGMIEKFAWAENVMSFGNSRELSGRTVAVRPDHRILEVARGTMISSSYISPNKSGSSVLLNESPPTNSPIVKFGTYPKFQLQDVSSSMLNARRRQLTATVTSAESPMKQPRMATGNFNDRASTSSGGPKN